jgi:hypothetical protein
VSSDQRNITNGREIPSHFYADQPYVVRTDDGAWLSVLTTGEGREGATGQFVITQRSTDGGLSWTDEARMEERGAPENSWGVLLKAPSGRLFCFYVYNADNLRKIEADPGSPAYPDGYCYRVDSLGAYVFRYSDDHGRTWSSDRYTLPVREFDIDRSNPTGGAVRYFWNVGKPFVDDGAAYVPLHKVGGFGAGFFTSSEGALVASPDLLEKEDPSSASWTTLPDGEVGIRAPEGHGPIAEEHSFAVMSDGSFFCVYRTISGYSACSYSRDKGRTWSTPLRMQFADGRPIKHPRAANFAWRCNNGKYLYWFHNNGGPYVQYMHDREAGYPYSNRNPVWLSGGVEVDSPNGRIIQWSEPDIALYDHDPMVRMSYPDFFEEAGGYYVSETQKDVARIHQLDPRIVEGLWGPFGSVPGPAADTAIEVGQVVPQLPKFAERDSDRRDYGSRVLRHGFSLDMTLEVDAQHGFVFDNRNRGGMGIALFRNASGFEFLVSDGQYSVIAPFHSERPTGNVRLTILMDGGPRVISAVCDGRFADGGEQRQFGWTRFSPYMSDVTSEQPLRGGPGGKILGISLFLRCLRVSEAVALHRDRS